MKEPRPPLLIKRYGRTRLYDGAGTRYVTITDLKAWAAGTIRFVVIDAETGRDVTQDVLA